jgi:diguanylate cyclase (GGDEF)-like protein
MWETLLNTGSWQGELMDRRKNGDVYPKWLSITVVLDEKGDISNYIALFSDITERKASYERIQYLAHFDALTNLPNRALLNDQLDMAIAMATRSQRQLAIVFLDLDRFKIVNDSLGHHTGDLLLQIVAERLKSCVRETDIVARLGGDEFVILLNCIQEPNEAAFVAQKVVEAIAIPFTLNGNNVNIGTSIGIAIYPDNGLDHSTLIKNADAAMYHAKENGRNNFQFFSSLMNDKAFERLTLENDLRQALKREEFFLLYQPQIDVLTGRIVGAEALIRWQHPEKGLVPPNDFISLAEKCGLIVPIGEWVLKTACAQNISWQKEGLAPVLTAVNISAQQFHQKNFNELIRQILGDTGLDPHLLELEITESAVMANAESMLETLRSLKEIGLHLSIDDFGTGYSSLSYLKHFPINKLKIDRSFVTDITHDSSNKAIIETIINMGHNLRLKVITEGVETAEQFAILKELRCDEIQGYYFSRAISPRDFVTFAKNNRQG